MPEINRLSTIRLDDPEVSTQTNRTNEFSEIIDIQVPAGWKYQFPANKPVELFVMAHEQFTTNGTASDQENFDLSNELVDSPALSGGGADTAVDSNPPGSGQADVVLYENGTQVAPDEVRYRDASSNPNRIKYTDDGTNNTLDVYYVWGNSSQMHGLQKDAALEHENRRIGETMDHMHTSKTFSQDEKITFDNFFTLEPKQHLKFQIVTPVDLTNWNATSELTSQSDENVSAPTSGAYSYSSMRIPVQKTRM